MDETAKIPVALTACGDYEPATLDAAVDALMTAVGPNLAPGSRILVKPNLISARKGPLACSEPAFIASICRRFMDAGSRVAVADSPAFGTASGVAEKCGLADALRPLGLRVRTLKLPLSIELSRGGGIGVSRDALESDLIVSAPRLKAHCQMRITGCLKNLFGCVPGMRKATAHHRFGDRGDMFESMIMDVATALPPSFAILDAVTAMHVTGPHGGRPIDLGFLAAGNCLAVDTAIYGMLGLAPDDLSLWREARARGLPAAFSENLAFPLDSPEDFDCSDFKVPVMLDPVSFNPWRLATGAFRRFRARLGG
jgi:uncharacterized protein (DUF362 family)